MNKISIPNSKLATCGSQIPRGRCARCHSGNVQPTFTETSIRKRFGRSRPM